MDNCYSPRLGRLPYKICSIKMIFQIKVQSEMDFESSTTSFLKGNSLQGYLQRQ